MDSSLTRAETGYSFDCMFKTILTTFLCLSKDESNSLISAGFFCVPAFLAFPASQVAVSLKNKS